MSTWWRHLAATISPVLIGELEHALYGGSAVDGGVALTEHGNQLPILGDPDTRGQYYAIIGIEYG